jgi:elongation factor Tu
MFRMTVGDVFFIRGRGLVATGKVEEGVLRVGDEVRINDGEPVRVDGIEAFRKTLEQAQAGENIGVLLRGLDKGGVSAGDVMTSADGTASAPTPADAASLEPQSGRDPRFAATETQRTQFLSMREAGLMTDEQIDQALAGMAFSAAGRNWKLTAGSDAWLASDGGDWKHETPPS